MLVKAALKAILYVTIMVIIAYVVRGEFLGWTFIIFGVALITSASVLGQVFKKKLSKREG